MRTREGDVRTKKRDVKTKKRDVRIRDKKVLQKAKSYTIVRHLQKQILYSRQRKSLMGTRQKTDRKFLPFPLQTPHWV